MNKRKALIIASPKEPTGELNQMLEEGGYQVMVAVNGDEAVSLAEQQLPEVILLEIQSPDLKGLEVLRRLKKRGTTASLPVIVLLEKFDEEYVAQGLQMGATEYLVKPFIREIVLRRVGVLARVLLKEKSQREVLERYKGFFDGEQHGLFLSTPEGRFLDVNQNLVKLLGYESRDELLKVDIKEDIYWDAKDRERFQQIIETQGYIKNFKVNFKRKDGQRITMLLDGQVVRDEKGKIIGYQGDSMDISDRAETTESLPLRPDTQRFLGRFLKHLVPKVIPFGGDFFSLMKMTELIGERYEKIKRLGLGSFGEVWKVRDIYRQGRAPFYVAKIPRSKKLNNQFRKEAHICQKLAGHPNAVKLIDVVEERGRVVLVQEFVRGRSLKEFMESSLSEAQKESIVIQLVDIVAYAHEQRIMHRDIKPENILIKRDGLVKLLDYGVAKELKDQDMSSTMVGSRPFMAPEQIMGESQIASDVWALGVIIYAVYTEYLPFYHENEKVLMDIILSGEPEPPRKIEPEIPVELESIILKCLTKNIKERFADAGELKASLLEKFPHFGDRLPSKS
ncbi:MAG: protein kinase [Deltaproteobacteria bacterium]|jgi:PAS domain S-box-containing protein